MSVVVFNAVLSPAVVFFIWMDRKEVDEPPTAGSQTVKSCRAKTHPRMPTSPASSFTDQCFYSKNAKHFHNCQLQHKHSTITTRYFHIKLSDYKGASFSLPVSPQPTLICHFLSPRNRIFSKRVSRMRMCYTKKKGLVWSFVVRPAIQTAKLKGRVKNPTVRGHCLNMRTTVHIFK